MGNKTDRWVLGADVKCPSKVKAGMVYSVGTIQNVGGGKDMQDLTLYRNRIKVFWGGGGVLKVWGGITQQNATLVEGNISSEKPSSILLQIPLECMSHATAWPW